MVLFIVYSVIAYAFLIEPWFGTLLENENYLLEVNLGVGCQNRKHGLVRAVELPTLELCTFLTTLCS